MLESSLILLAAGLAAGFVAGLVGVGGGIIFAPVLLFYFDSAGVSGSALAPLTIGTSLFCTLLTSSVSAFHHLRRGAVMPRVAVVTGLASAAGVIAVTSLVTTRPWYDQTEFQIAFSAVLLFVAVRMAFRQKRDIVPAGSSGAADSAKDQPPPDHNISSGGLAAVGAIAGVVSSAVGVGGGVVLVPAFNRIVRLPIHTSVGTSSATIIIISLFGVITYALAGLESHPRDLAIGFVDPLTALALSVPAALTTRAGVATAHRFDQRALRIGFAVFAVMVAVRLIMGAVST